MKVAWFCLWCLVSSPLLGETAQEHVIDGISADIISGTPKDRGPTLLQFWASWCHRCSTVFADLGALKELSPDLRHFAISIDEERGQAERYLAKLPSGSFGSDIVFLHDVSKALASKYRVESVPTIVLLGGGDNEEIYRLVGHISKSKVLRIAKKLGTKQTSKKGVNR